jgi:hypothetical protein
MFGFNARNSTLSGRDGYIYRISGICVTIFRSSWAQKRSWLDGTAVQADSLCSRLFCILFIRTKWLTNFFQKTIHDEQFCLLVSRWQTCCFTLISCFVFSSNLKMEATYSSETSFDFQRTTQRYIPEDKSFHNHSCENQRPYIAMLMVENSRMQLANHCFVTPLIYSESRTATYYA